MFFKKISEHSIEFLWIIISFLIPKNQNKIIINTFPDFDDTARAFIEQIPNKKINIIILRNSKQTKAPEWLKSKHIKSYYKLDFYGIWHYHRSKWIFFTHGLFSKWKLSKNQIVINLWHGMPIKNIGLLDNKKPSKIPKFNYTIAHNDFFKEIIQKAFGVTDNNIIINLHPRIDILHRKPNKELKLPFGDGYRLCVWLPTYRKSIIGDKREDGNIKKEILNDSKLLSEIDQILYLNNTKCVIKPHPMSLTSSLMGNKYKNIIIIDEKLMIDLNTSLYEILSLSDFLITDISSVYFDYKTTSKPIVIFFEDIEEYNGSRGLVSPIDKLIQEKIISDKNELSTAIVETISSLENHKKPVELKSNTLSLIKKLQIAID